MKRFLFHQPSASRQYLISLVVVCGISLLGLSLYGILGYRVAAFMLLVGVSFLAMFLDIKPVLMAAFLSALIWDFFFIPPRFTITVGTPEDRLLLLMYFIVALINAVLTNKIRKMEREVKEKDEKERSVRFYNTLLHSLSHEIKTPITTIIGSTDTIINNPLSEKNKTDLINEISIASLRLNQQVENLLSMSRLESGVFKLKKDWCDVHELVHKTINRLEANLQRYRLTIDIPDTLPLFKLDFGLMEQVVYNLILNVTQHTPEDTAVTIQAKASNHTLILSIADNGNGFPENEIENVFEKFYRVKGSPSGGTGLGLSIVKGFVEAHNGRIKLENLPIKGSKFTLEIPTETAHITRLTDEE